MSRWYEIIDIQLKLNPVEGQEPTYPVGAAVTIQEQGKKPEQLVVLLGEPDIRQIKNLLRQRIDKELNGG